MADACSRCAQMPPTSLATVRVGWIAHGITRALPLRPSASHLTATKHGEVSNSGWRVTQHNREDEECSEDESCGRPKAREHRQDRNLAGHEHAANLECERPTLVQVEQQQRHAGGDGRREPSSAGLFVRVQQVAAHEDPGAQHVDRANGDLGRTPSAKRPRRIWKHQRAQPTPSRGVVLHDGHAAGASANCRRGGDPASAACNATNSHNNSAAIEYVGAWATMECLREVRLLEPVMIIPRREVRIDGTPRRREARRSHHVNPPRRRIFHITQQTVATRLNSSLRKMEDRLQSARRRPSPCRASDSPTSVEPLAAALIPRVHKQKSRTRVRT